MRTSTVVRRMDCPLSAGGQDNLYGCGQVDILVAPQSRNPGLSRFGIVLALRARHGLAASTMGANAT